MSWKKTPSCALLLRYSEAMHAQTMQTAACNGRHNLEQRLARWLLMAHDRADSDVLPLTQEFLSFMLCVYRPSITVVAKALQKAASSPIPTPGRATLLCLTGKVWRKPHAIVIGSCRSASNSFSDEARGPALVCYQTVKVQGRVPA